MIRMTQADQGIWRSLEAETILDEALEEMQDVLGLPMAAICLLNETGGDWACVRKAGDLIEPILDVSLNPDTFTLAQQGQLQIRLQQITHPKQTDLVSVTTVLTPILSPPHLGQPRQCLGLLVAGFKAAESKQNPADQYADLQELGEQLYTALSHARLYADLQFQTERLTSLHHIGWEVATNRDLTASLNEVGERLRDILRADVVMIYRYNQQTERLEHARIYGDIYGKGQLRIPAANKGVIARILTEQEPYYTSNAQTDPLLSAPGSGDDGRKKAVKQRSFTVRQGIMAFAGIPMLANDAPVGVLCVNYRRQHPFSANERQMLEIAAQFAGAALRNAEMNDLAEALITSRTQMYLASQLHDSLSQYLPAIRLMADTTQAYLKQDPAKAHEQLEKIKSVTIKAIDAVRVNIFELNTRVADDQHLIRSIEIYIREAQNFFHLDIQFNTNISRETVFPTLIVREMVMICREAIANTAKHAQASQLEIDLSQTEAGVILRLTDDGCGFEPDRVRAKSRRGLTMMRQRAEALGGTFQVQSEAGEGAQIEVFIPVE